MIKISSFFLNFKTRSKKLIKYLLKEYHLLFQSKHLLDKLYNYHV